jgi:hypothetical protein
MGSEVSALFVLGLLGGFSVFECLAGLLFVLSFLFGFLREALDLGTI